MKRIAFLTVGCKLNQFETEQMREAAEASGYQPSGDPAEAEVCVINTCTVTSKGDCRSRQAVRRALRANPGALVVVTGCYAQRKPAEVALIEGVDVVLGNAEKASLEAYIGLDKQRKPLVLAGGVEAMAVLADRRHLRGFGRYTRAFVKIQDGCDNRCTYCAVPLVRGSSRSKLPDEVGREVECLAGQGYKEIVLTGVHLGSYGRDLARPTSLVALAAALARTPGLVRLRLSSVEPADFTDDLVALVADPSSKICPHVHVPLQSGDDGVLKAMGRPYDRAYYRRLIERLAAANPRCGIGADVMVGFPLEDQRAFSNTEDLIGDLPFTYLHVFAFSPREGTPASRLGNQVGPGEIKARSLALRTLGARKAQVFRQSLVGGVLETLVLGGPCGRPPAGLSGNYVKVFFDSDLKENTIVEARVTGTRAGGVEATVAAD